MRQHEGGTSFFRRPERTRSRDRLLPFCRQMHAIAPSIIVKSGRDLAGYALTMTLEALHHAPRLRPMFRLFESLDCLAVATRLGDEG